MPLWSFYLKKYRIRRYLPVDIALKNLSLKYVFMFILSKTKGYSV